MEQNADGALWLAHPEVYVVNDARTHTADQARALAAELLEAVAVIDGITQ